MHQPECVEAAGAEDLGPLPLLVREARGSDWPFIHGYWVDSYVKGRKRHRRSPGLLQLVRDNVIALREDSRVRFAVAYAPDEPDYLYGFMCAEPPNVLHYVYVKETYRGHGVGLSLLAHCGLASAHSIFCTHWTNAADRISKQHPIYRRTR